MISGASEEELELANVIADKLLLQKENQELKEKLDKYENPEDMTLFAMWCTEKVKEENEKLKKQLEERTKMYQNAYDYSQKMEGKAIVLETQQKDLKKQVEDLFSENRNLRKKLENCMTFEDYKYTLNKKIKLETQQKEFIKHLEDKIYSIEPKGTGINYNCEYDSEEDYVMAMQEQSRLNTLKEILQKYKEIIGE